MWGIVPDANCEGHFRVLLRLLHNESRREFWHFLNLAVLTFDELGLPADASDRQVWETCQQREVVLITANRTAEGTDSLEAVIQTSNTRASLPVVTLANVERIRRDRNYAAEVADRLLDYLFDIESFRGVGRVFVP
ncbi:MAG: ACP S-malonyltransferase [Planctomycetes bacterium]|nr:ACP S-malonyltransferase [Planctomycetota bacterium]